MHDEWAASRCDSCGADLPEMATACDYCGRQASFCVKGVRFAVLIGRLTAAKRYEEVGSLASDILRENPDNAVAWASKGMAILRLTPVATDDVVQGALKCFEYAEKLSTQGGLVDELRREAGTALCEHAISVLQSFVQVPSRERFDQIHRHALAADRIWPEGRSLVDEILRNVDDESERNWGMLYVEGDYQRTRRPQGEAKPNGFWGSLWVW